MWRRLLPDTPFPACGTPANIAAVAPGQTGGTAAAENNVDETAVRDRPHRR